MSEVRDVLAIIDQIQQTNMDAHDVRWVLLSQALDPSRGKEPIVRHEQLREMISQAVHSPAVSFRTLVYRQLALQMPFDGSKQFIVRRDVHTLLVLF